MPGDDPARLLAQLVRIPSVNPMGRAGATREGGYFEEGVTAFLESFLRDRGIATRRQAALPGRDNLLACYEAPGARRTLLFDAHQDTVPVEGMTVEPFGAHVEGRRLYGRGACDIKGGLTAMLLAFVRLARERPAGSASVLLALTVDEEYTHRGSSVLAADPGRSIDLAVVAEPTGFDLVTSHKGAVRWRVVASGVACHSSTPALGDNAVYRMGRVLAALEAYARGLAEGAADAVLGPASLSVGTIRGGVSVNVVPDACSIEVDRRVIPGEDPEAVRDEVAEWLRGRLDAADFARLSFSEPWVRMPALRPMVDGATLEAIGGVVRRCAGRSPEVRGVPFGTDAGPLGRAGIASLVIGPGDIAQAHTKDEWIDLDELAAGVEVYHGMACALG
jgi:acetylornithine deacetylase